MKDLMEKIADAEIEDIARSDADLAKLSKKRGHTLSALQFEKIGVKAPTRQASTAPTGRAKRQVGMCILSAIRIVTRREPDGEPNVC